MNECISDIEVQINTSFLQQPCFRKLYRVDLSLVNQVFYMTLKLDYAVVYI